MRMPSLKTNHFMPWLPVILLCAAIFIQSSFPSPDMGPTFPMQDKALHLLAYGLLAALFFRACRLTWPARRPPWQLFLFSVLFATLYGASDEFHQAFVVARQADILDFLADLAGSVLGATLWLVVTRRQGARRQGA